MTFYDYFIFLALYPKNTANPINAIPAIIKKCNPAAGNGSGDIVSSTGGTGTAVNLIFGVTSEVSVFVVPSKSV